MNVVEKINLLIADMGITRREFAKRLRALEPQIRSTGEIPSEQSIYRYLNGNRELKVELIPYIAHILGVDESELFSFDVEDTFGFDTALSKEARDIVKLLPYAPASVIRDIKIKLEKYKKLYDDEI
ncbi:MAG: helix-turn-helix domain-containing protein [Campylobacteraceae bacterium]|nr:helix-turn-helix domain-containing protein [Campylobacteraceae bacterium]